MRPVSVRPCSPRFQLTQEERTRSDLMRIFVGTPCAAWPRHLQWYQQLWARERGELTPEKVWSKERGFDEADRARWYAELAFFDKRSAGHH